MKLHPTIEALVEEIDACVRRTGTTRTAFGLGAINDPNLYRHLKAGRAPNIRTLDRIREFLARSNQEAAA